MINPTSQLGAFPNDNGIFNGGRHPCCGGPTSGHSHAHPGAPAGAVPPGQEGVPGEGRRSEDEVVQPFGGLTATSAATLDHRHSTWTLRSISPTSNYVGPTLELHPTRALRKLRWIPTTTRRWHHSTVAYGGLAQHCSTLRGPDGRRSLAIRSRTVEVRLLHGPAFGPVFGWLSMTCNRAHSLSRTMPQTHHLPVHVY